MRSRQEIAFRLKQEIANLRLSMSPPSLPGALVIDSPRLPAVGPVANRLHGSAFAEQVIGLAGEIMHHRFPLFGNELDAGDEIRWRRDYIHQVETGTAYFRRIPYLDFARVGDHKMVWELNRHQHLVVLAQAYRFTGEQAYLAEAMRQIESWIAANPYMHGMNWTSALEVAFRALSWMWFDHLAGASLPDPFRRRFLTALYRHGRYLEHNLSIYFSPNTHLLGEAVALHAVGTLYSGFPAASRWAAAGGEVVREQMQLQVRGDGSHFEQSSYYHVYALDFFLLHDLLSESSAAYRDKLIRMAGYLNALMGLARRLPLFGDDDGGRLFHPYGERDCFGRASLATAGVRLARPEWIGTAEDLHEQAAWWIGEPALAASPGTRAPAASHLFRDAGVAVMTAGDAHIVIKAGPFGASTAGHSHSDVLSVVCRRGARDLLVDPGTYTYLADPEWRNRFRGASAHNTLRIDERDQAVAAGPFRWRGLPETAIREWTSTADRDFLDAECRYAGFRHRRRFLFQKPDLLFVLDEVSGTGSEHLVEQFWHLGDAPDAAARLAFAETPETVKGWRSHVFGSKEPACVLRVARCGILPTVLAAAVCFDALPNGLTLKSNSAGHTVEVHLRDGRTVEAYFDT
ncbi:MAG TPA: alginate lyase family protein [Bryobacteraceae bacterium]|nr:alginate lyase family protein [Bryobacteraceae bacterium]